VNPTDDDTRVGADPRDARATGVERDRPFDPMYDREDDMATSTAAIGVSVGVLGGLALSASPPFAELWLPIGVAYGVLVGGVLRHRRVGPGGALAWSLGFAPLVWLALVLGEAFLAGGPTALVGADLRGGFPVLVRVVLGLATPVGLAVGLWRRRTVRDEAGFRLTRAFVGGTVAGVVGGAVFGVWMAQAGVLPLIAEIVGSTSPTVGAIIHFLVAVTVGVTFGLLFGRDVRGPGSSLAWGMAYGVFWWMLGGLTLLPLLSGGVVDWSADAAAAGLGSFLGHVVYGLLVGRIYASVDRAWSVLFFQSDPLNREVEAPAVRTVQAMLWGLAASLAGSLLFGVVLWRTGELPTVAALVGSSVPAVGFLVHMVVGSTIGLTYGLFFRYESSSFGSSVTWGALYGLIWWVFGPLTLLPALLGQPLGWTPEVVASALPSLVGHLVYGVTTGAVFWVLERRQRAWARIDPRMAERERRRRRQVGTPAPAVWVFDLSMGVLVLAFLI
jgi:uncharacterized membrane protein YagU involved in acid resistance